MTRYDPVPPRAGHVAAVTVWRWDPARKRYRLTQVVYEPRGRKAKEDKSSKRPRRGALAAERQGNLL